MVDIFVYVVVLNLFVEYLPGVLSETFTLSLVTAVLLKGVLEIVVAVKNRVKARFRQASFRSCKLTLLWGECLAGNKIISGVLVSFCSAMGFGSADMGPTRRWSASRFA